MLRVLANPTFRAVYLAQVISLIGTGVATVALGLMAYQIAGAGAGAVLGTALALKTLTTAGLSSFITAALEKFPRRRVLVGLELMRGSVMLAFPFVTEIWHIYLLIVLLHSASAGLVPSLRATIPDILPDERDYTRALALTQLSYDMETVASPFIALLLLSMLPLNGLFIATVGGFVASAALLASASVPAQRFASNLGVGARAARGVRLYLGTPMLKGLLALTFSAACASAMVLVNTVVLVQSDLGLEPHFTVLALGVFGCGSMTAAMLIPILLERFPVRATMVAGGCICLGALMAGSLITSYAVLLVLWFGLGAGYSLILTPAGRLVAGTAGSIDRSALFAAQFALTHACWLVAYLTAGLSGAAAGTTTTFLVLAAMATGGFFVAARVWPSDRSNVAAAVRPDRGEP
jgi:MFS family permease